MYKQLQMNEKRDGTNGDGLKLPKVRCWTSWNSLYLEYWVRPIVGVVVVKYLQM